MPTGQMVGVGLRGVRDRLSGVEALQKERPPNRSHEEGSGQGPVRLTWVGQASADAPVARQYDETHETSVMTECRSAQVDCKCRQINHGNGYAQEGSHPGHQPGSQLGGGAAGCSSVLHSSKYYAVCRQQRHCNGVQMDEALGVWPIGRGRRMTACKLPLPVGILAPFFTPFAKCLQCSTVQEIPHSPSRRGGRAQLRRAGDVHGPGPVLVPAAVRHVAP